MLRAARNPVECAFGRLKALWSILTRKIDFKLESVPILVYSYDNGEGEFGLSVLTSYINDKLPDDLM